MLNNPEDVLSILLRGVLGRSGRKRTRRASRFLGGRGGFLTASTLMTVAGVAWGIYDSMRGGAAAAPGGLAGSGGAVGVPPMPPVPGAAAALPSVAGGIPDTLSPEVLRLIRLAVSAARADGDLAAQERALILERARDAGVEAAVEAELSVVRPLSDIAAGVSDDAHKRDLYVLAFTIVRADETVTGAERIYLAQLASQLGLGPADTQRLEADTAAAIDAQPE